jgi:hypothetical protein
MKIDKNRKLKGSVLLTVVSVMALLIIFMASTVTLATAANNRSHANYSDSQAEYTARAAIEGFSQALTTNNALAQSILAMDKGDTFTPAVVINDPGMGNVGYYDGNHWVSDRIKIEYIKDNWGYDEEKAEWANMQVLKVTATARVGKQEKSICYYLEKTGESSPSKSNNIKGFQTLGGGGMQNNGTFSGALCLGLGQPDTIDDGHGNSVPIEYGTSNDFMAYVTDGFVNGSLVQNMGSNFEWHVPTSDSHFVVTQDLGVNNAGFNIFVDYPYAKTSTGGQFTYEDFGQKDIPYLYVGGRIRFHGTGEGGLTVKNEGVNNGRAKSKDSPFNIFAGSCDVKGMSLQATDLYLFDDDPNQVSYPAGSTKISEANLYKWSSSVINKTADQFYSEGGSIYCNHNMEIYQALKVKGNLVIQGNLTIGQNGSVEVGGDLVIKGRCYRNTDVGTDKTANDTLNKITCHGRIFYDTTDTVAYYLAKNSEASGSLKPGYVKVENAEFGTYRVDNIEIINKPVEGEIVEVPNKQVTNPATVVICNGKNGDWSGWKIEDTNQPIEVVGNVAANWVDYSQASVYYVDGKGYTSVPYYVSNPDGTSSADITVEATTKYYKIGTQIISADEAGAKYLLCDGKGNATEKIVDFASEYYIAGPDGEPTEEYTTDFVLYTYYAYNKDGEVTTTKVDDKPVFYIVNPETGDVDTHTTDEPVSYYYYDAEADTFHTATESEAMDTSGGTKYVAWYNPLVPATAEYYYYDVDPRPLADNPAELAAHQITEAEAVNRANTSYFSVSSYPGYSTNPIGSSVYPKNMTKAALNAGSTKIVKQLDEAIRDIGGDPDVDVTQAGASIIPDGAYNSNYDYSAITNVIDISSKGGQTINIDQSTVITGTAPSGQGVTFKIKATSGMFIVLKDTKISSNGVFIVEGNDTVNFLLDGDVNIEKLGIFTNKILNQFEIAIVDGKPDYFGDQTKNKNINKVVRINESDKMNINMYGKKGSTLTVGNGCFVCASARCPFTKLTMATGATGMAADWRYVDNYNHIITPTNGKMVNWIGSGLFDSSSALSNNFKLLYTNSTGDANDEVKNDQVIGANWYAKYYDAY